VVNLSDKSSTLIGFSGSGGAGTGSGLVACTLCGDQETWLVGVNWWLNDYTRLALNVTQSEISGGNDGFPKGSGTGYNRNNGAQIQGVGFRAQVDW